MTLEEAIKRYNSNAFYEKTDGNLQGYLEFNQFAEWLKDYKRLLEQGSILDKIRAEIGNLQTFDTEIIYGLIDTTVELREVFRIIDKYKAEGSEE